MPKSSLFPRAAFGAVSARVMSAMDEGVPEMVLNQRVRNWIMEYFELASSRDNLLEYQREVPYVSVS